MEIEEREVIIFPERLQKYKNRKKFFKNRKCKTSRWFAKIEVVTKRRTLESPLLASLNLDPSEENFERLQGLFSNKDKAVYKY